jgi:alpha-tubulin suppressor-like RCC1 family protein
MLDSVTRRVRARQLAGLAAVCGVGVAAVGVAAVGAPSPAAAGTLAPTGGSGPLSVYQAGNKLKRGSWVEILSSGNVEAVDEENQFALAIVGGHVEAWGRNGAGQLGDGTRTDSPLTPVVVEKLDDVVQVDGGDSYALAVTAAGRVYAWGNGSDGELGLGQGDRDDQDVSVPRRIPAIEHVTQVSAGANHSLALLSDGTVDAWGTNAAGELGIAGLSTSAHVGVPTPVPGLRNVVAVSAGCEWSLALLADGRVMAWGLDDLGQLGDGARTNSHVPVQVAGLTDIVQISAGGNYTNDGHALALGADGQVWAWGDNSDGQLGVPGVGKESDRPVAVSSLDGGDIMSVSAGGRASAAVGADGTLYQWGDNGAGQLGMPGGPEATPQRSTLRGSVVAAWAGALGTAATVYGGPAST